MQSENGCKYTDICDGTLQSIKLLGPVTFNVLHLNIRSLHKNCDQLVMLLKDLQERGIIVHAIGLAETFLTETSKNFVSVENYQILHRCRTSRCGGGTSLLIHDSVKLQSIVDTPFNEFFESIAATVTYRGHSIFVAEFYRPPNNSNDRAVKDCLSELLMKSKNFDLCFLCTDQNYDLIKTDSHKQTREFFAFLVDNNCIPYILKPTRVTHVSSTLIDNIYVKSKSKRLRRNVSYIITDSMSDHYPCLLAYSLANCKPNLDDLYIEKRKISDEAVLKVQQDLLFHDWCYLDTNISVNDSYEYLSNTIENSLNKHAPKKTVKIRADERFMEPWLTVKIQKYNQKCRKLCDRARTSKDPAKFNKYKEYRNALNRIKHHEKRAYYKELFERIGKTSKFLWEVVKGIVKKANNKLSTPEILHNNVLYSDEKVVCNLFNDHFVTAGERVKASIKTRSKVNPCQYVHKVPDIFRFTTVTEGEICRIVYNMKPKTSSGIDNISNWLLKKLIHVIKLPLCMIIKRSLFEGVYPDLLKIATVHPLHKGGDKMLTDNYRPISLLPVISKVLEKLVFNRVTNYLEKNNVIYAKQYGFRRGHSTTDAIFNLVGEILKAFENDQMVLSIFIDLRKAFDTVSHSVLLEKLAKLGIISTELNWFESYLNDRKQN